MKTRILSCLLLFLIAGITRADLLDGRWDVTGEAYDRQTGKLLYTEHHRIAIRNQFPFEHTVVYRHPDGTPLANKTLDYSHASFAPDFQLEDLRDGYIEGGRTTENGYQLIHRKNAATPTERANVSPPPNLDLVADAGFDAYVKTHLATLQDGEPRQFRLAVAGQLDSYTFEAHLAETYELFGRPAARIRIQPASLLRLIVAPIDITYDLETTALLRYEGLSNIRDKDGNRYDTRIDFPPDIQRRHPDSE